MAHRDRIGWIQRDVTVLTWMVATTIVLAVIVLLLVLLVA